MDSVFKDTDNCNYWRKSQSKWNMIETSTNFLVDKFVKNDTIDSQANNSYP